MIALKSQPVNIKLGYANLYRNPKLQLIYENIVISNFKPYDIKLKLSSNSLKYKFF